MARLKRIPEFEGLRGYLAWWVFVFHAITIAGYSENDFPRGIRLLVRGEYPVDVFIILSGFVIFMLLESKRQSYRTFITQRFFRLYPVFIVVFTLAVLAHPLRIESLSWISWSLNDLDTLRITRWHETDNHYWQNIFGHLTLLHSAIPETLLPTSSTAFLSPAWSVSLEWQFYLVAPFLFIVFRKYKVSSWLTLILACYIINKLYFSELITMFPLQGFLIQKLLLFWIGIGSFYLWHMLIDHKKLRAQLGILLFAGFCPLIFPLTLSIPLTIWFTVFAIALTKSQNDNSSQLVNIGHLLLCNRAAQYMGAISYSIYLCHEVCIYLTHWTILKYQLPETRLDIVFWMLACAAPLSLLMASALHYSIERPGIHLGRKLTTPNTI